jgi:pilus assembly protein Flp/PilA
MLGRIRGALRRSDGASAVEYGIIVSLVAAVIVGIVFLLGTRTKSLYSSSNSCLETQGTTC